MPNLRLELLCIYIIFGSSTEMQSFTIFAEQALTPAGWQRDVLVSVSADGRIVSVEAQREPSGNTNKAGVLLPSPANLHSHAFQRAMAGLTERRGPDPWAERREEHHGCTRPSRALC